MSDYYAPIQDMQFVIDEIAGLDSIAKLPGFEDATPDLVEAVLEQAGAHLDVGGGLGAGLGHRVEVVLAAAEGEEGGKDQVAGHPNLQKLSGASQATVMPESDPHG